MGHREICFKLKKLIDVAGLPDKLIQINFNPDRDEYLYTAFISNDNLRICRFSSDFVQNYFNNFSEQNKKMIINKLKHASSMKLAQIPELQ